MQATERGTSYYATAILIGGIAYAVAFVVEQYILVFLFDSYDMGFKSYVFEALLFGLPPFILAVITAFVAYDLRYRVSDTDCRCRKCGYILKGISEPKCSECGEPI